MTYRFQKINGSLNALMVLEAVVRNMSFTGAATELSLSQPTVSRHIATLENRLNRSLFTRSGNQVQPTKQAYRLASAIALGFGHAETAWEEIQYKTDEDQVTIACSFGFAENWLMPRYASLKRVLGNTRLRISTFDNPSTRDLSRTDIAIVWDISLTPDRPYFSLFTEQAFPICSREYLQKHPNIANNIKSLATAELLHFDVGDSGFITWRLWFAAQGVDYRPADNAHQYDALPFFTQAVLDGEGVGIGWRYLVDQKLEDGQLVQIGPSLTNREAAYFLQYRNDRSKDKGVKKVVDWFNDAIR